MTYRLRAGWIETLVGAGSNGALRSRYHASADCARIHESDTLRRVDKPHGAPGCPACTTQDGACDASREPAVSESAVLPEALIGQAQGILMALNQSDADAAWTALQRVSNEFDISPRALAEATIAIATTLEPRVDAYAATAVHELLDPVLRIADESR